MALKIFLCDLVHNQHYTYYSVPLNIASVGARLKQRFGYAVEIRLFKFPDVLMSQLPEKPDILALSNYDWNYNLNRMVASVARQINPNILISMGGPNIRKSTEGIRKFLMEFSEVDVYSLHEGEDAFSELVNVILSEWPCDVKKTILSGGGKIKQNAYIAESGDEFIIGQLCDSIDEDPVPYPSAWLSGMLDEFLENTDYPLHPSIETSRGCPYGCYYCTWGSYEKKKIRKYNYDVIIEELDYIFKRASKSSYFIVCDANFGILERDLAIAEEIRRLSEKYNTISEVEVFTDKNNVKRNLEVCKILKNLSVPCFAVQSFNKLALKNAGRRPIKEERIQTFVDEIIRGGMEVYTDLLIGIPGETRETHINNIKKSYDLGFFKSKIHDIRLLRGSKMEEDDYIQEFGIQTEFRVIPAAYGNYDGNKVIEYEKCIRKTNSMSKQDFQDLRLFHGYIYFLINTGFGTPVLEFARACGVHPIEVIQNILKMPSKSKYPTLFKYIGEYKQQSESEWFKSEEEANDYYFMNEVFEKIVKKGFKRLNTDFAASMVVDPLLKYELLEYLTASIIDLIGEEKKLILAEIGTFCIHRIYSYPFDPDVKEIVISGDTLNKIKNFVDIDPEIDTNRKIIVMFSDANLREIKRKISRYKGNKELSSAIQVILHDDTRLLIRNGRASNG